MYFKYGVTAPTWNSGNQNHIETYIVTGSVLVTASATSSPIIVSNNQLQFVIIYFLSSHFNAQAGLRNGIRYSSY